MFKITSVKIVKIHSLEETRLSFSIKNILKHLTLTVS